MPESDAVFIPPAIPPEVALRLKDALAIARREIISGRGDPALQLLRGIKRDIEAIPGTPLWAEYQLELGEALAAKNDQEADYVFQEALQRIKNLPTPEPELEVRAHESFGKFLTPYRPSRARQEYELAKQIAMRHRLGPRNAEIELKIVKIDLKNDEDPELTNFQTMRRVGNQDGYTPEEELAAWHQHLGCAQESLLGRKFARKENLASEEYFRKLLKSVRENGG